MNPASVKARLRNLSIHEGKAYDYLQIHYMIERLLYRLSVSPYASDFVLKGGLLLHAIFEDKARATRDIDLLARHTSNSLENLKQVFTEICSISSDDAVVYDINTLSVEAIQEEADYHGVRVKVVGYLERSRSMLQFDIGFGDAIVPNPVQMIYPSLLGTDEIMLYAYSTESVIAEKFQAMVYLAQANSRMKDFYDIYMLSTVFDYEGPILQEALRQTLERRDTMDQPMPVLFTEQFAALPDKQTQWMAFTKRTHCEGISFEQILKQIYSFLFPVYQSIWQKQPFHFHWNHESNCWMEAQQ